MFQADSEIQGRCLYCNLSISKRRICRRNWHRDIFTQRAGCLVSHLSSITQDAAAAAVAVRTLN